MPLSDGHILTTVLLTPAAGALAISFIQRDSVRRWVANAAAILAVLLSVLVAVRFHGAGGQAFQFVQDLSWIPAIDVRYTLGIDGISLLMVLLTTVFSAVAIARGWGEARRREYYVLLLALETSMLGTFVALDLVLFYMFWILALIPMYFLIALWGGRQGFRAALRFLLFMLAGSLAMLLAILAIYLHAHTFSIQAIVESPAALLSPELQRPIFWVFFLAFAVRASMFPFHTWLPEAVSEAPASACILLCAVLLKMGTYGFLRFSVSMLPEACVRYHGAAVFLSIVAIVYGALICLVQQDFKRLIAYFSISQLGFCTLGIFALTRAALSGSVVHQVSHGISVAGLLLVAALISRRRETQSIGEFGGLWESMPAFSAVYLAITLSAIGTPLLSGFVGEFTILRGAFEARWQWSLWGVIGVALTAACFLWFYQRITFGEARPEHGAFADLDRGEYACLIPLVVLTLWIGIYPAPLFRALESPVEAAVQRCYPASSGAQTADAAPHSAKRGGSFAPAAAAMPANPSPVRK